MGKWQEVTLCSPFLSMRTVSPGVGTCGDRDEGAEEQETVWPRS